MFPGGRQLKEYFDALSWTPLTPYVSIPRKGSKGVISWKQILAGVPKLAGVYFFREQGDRSGHLLYLGQTRQSLPQEITAHLSFEEGLGGAWKSGRPMEYAFLPLNHGANSLAPAWESLLLLEYNQKMGKLPSLNSQS